MAKAMRSEMTTEAPAPSASARPGEVVAAGSSAPQEAPLLVTFDRWFTAKKFKPQWKEGLQAFTNTSGRKTMEEWDLLFRNY